MALNAEISTALQILEQLQDTVDSTEDDKLRAQTKDDFRLLISTLQNPILRSIATIQGSLSELSTQLQEHPSILPADFNISESGELELSVQRSLYEPEFQSPLSADFDDQRVPVVKLSSSSGDQSSSSQINSPLDIALTPITTQSYALEFQRVIEETSQGREVHTIQLYKPDGNGLGFSVVGLKSEAKGELGIFVQEIQPTGISARDGRLREGDQILAIDGQPLDTNISHPQAISLLQQARGVVELVVARSTDIPINPPSPSASDTSKSGSDMVLSSDWAQVEVIDLINDGSGLGFGIVGGRSTGVVVKTILPGGVADRDGRLQSGDHILQIADVNLRGMGSEQVAAVLRQSGSRVRIVVARPVENSSPDFNLYDTKVPVVPSTVLADPDELDRYLAQHGYPPITNSNIVNGYNLYHNTEINMLNEQDLSLIRDVVPPSSLPVLTMDMIPLESLTHLPEAEESNIAIKKDMHGLGITIAGYVCEKEELSGIFVKSISEGSAADLSKKIQVNDRIVEVDGKSLQGLTNHEAVELLRSTGQIVNLRLERYLRGPKFEQLQMAIANSERNATSNVQVPKSPSVLSLPRFPILPDEESTTVIDIDGNFDTALLLDAVNNDIDLDALIDSNYEGPLKPTVEAALKAKWTNVVGVDVEIIVAQLCKFSESGGLGISLEGTVDVEDGVELRPHHYIRSILEEGPVGTNGKLRSGDELLEVNGHRLLGMNHVEVVKILKELPQNVRIVCARKENEMMNTSRLLDNSQDRAAFAARNVLGGSLQNLIPASERLVKAKSDGSLASTGTTPTDGSLSKLKSRSLEPLTGLAMWSSESQIIDLVKGERGLGFSILDYQDPMNPNDTVIVIRSLVPGGVAQLDGRLIPGDRLLSVNDTVLKNSTLDRAVQVLKGAPKGTVRIAVAKPLPVQDSLSTSEDVAKEVNWLEEAVVSADEELSLHSCSDYEPYKKTQVIRDSKSNLELDNWKETIGTKEDFVINDLKKIQLPLHLQRKIKLQKGNLPLGISLECTDDCVNGALVSEITEGGVFYKDGRVSVGDYILVLNNESLRKCTQSQARSILKRTQLLSTDISVHYIKAQDAFNYQKSNLKLRIPKPNISCKISPRSPYVDLISDDKSKPAELLRSKSEDLCGNRKRFSVGKNLTNEDEETLIPGIEISKSADDVLAYSERLSINNYSQSEESSFSKDSDGKHSDISISQLEFSSKSESNSTYLIDESLNADIIELGKLSKLHRLGSVDFECCGTGDITKTPERVKKIYRFASTGVELASDDSDMPIEYSDAAILAAKQWGPERIVQVPRSSNSSLGISVVGGQVDLQDRTSICGIFIKNVAKDSPAGKTGGLKDGDRILSVNGIDLRNATHEKGVEVIRSATDPVSFTVQSLIQWANEGIPQNGFNSLSVQKENKSSDEIHDTTNQIDSSRTSSKILKPTRKYSSDEDSSDTEDDSNEKVITKAGRKIMRDSAGSIDETNNDEEEDEFGYTMYKVKKKYMKQGKGVMIVELQKGNNGLGISLAGHKDRTKMAVYVCGINPSGAAFEAGCIKVGDEILEVNGVVLQGRCHLNASALIKGIPGTLFKIIIYRTEKNLDNLAVKPLTVFPTVLVEQSPEEKYSSFKGLRIITMKKELCNEIIQSGCSSCSTPQQARHGLGIMIMEGKRSDVGRGVFISDIQEGSVAEQAGLNVGDMILSVNKDDTLGASHDNVASLLKKAEGLVTLVVCNPNLPSSVPEMTEDSATAGNAVAPAAAAVVERDPVTDPIIPGQDCVIIIDKDEKPFGIGIVGGCDTILGIIVIHELYENGVAHKDGRLKPGDQILEINSVDFRSIQHKKAEQTLASSTGKITMLVYRDPSLADINSEKDDDLWDVFDVELMKKSNKGFGLSFVNREKRPGVYISDFLPDSPALTDGRLMKGDVILSVNEHDLRKSDVEECAILLKSVTGKVNLKIGRIKAKPSPSTSELSYNGCCRTVTLVRGPEGFGFSIVGGYGSAHGDLPIFVKSVFQETCKYLLRRGDEILSVDGITLQGLTHQEAVSVLKNSKNPVTLIVRS